MPLPDQVHEQGGNWVAPLKAGDKARADVRSGRTLAVPLQMRYSHYRGAQQLEHDKDYQYSHDHEGAGASRRICPKSDATINPSIAVMRSKSGCAWSSSANRAATESAAWCLLDKKK